MSKSSVEIVAAGCRSVIVTEVRTVFCPVADAAAAAAVRWQMTSPRQPRRGSARLSTRRPCDATALSTDQATRFGCFSPSRTTVRLYSIVQCRTF